MRVNGEKSTGRDPRGRDRARSDAASSPEEIARALEIVRERGPAMGAMPGLGWTPEDSSLAGAAAFYGRRSVGPMVAGIVGGASSGKSTLFNNLLGDGSLHTSLVTMRAHTTRGPVAAAGPGEAEMFRSWVEREGWGGWGMQGGERLPVATVAPDARTSGDERRMTVAQSGGMLGVVLVDTPDLTSLDAKEAGDLTRVMLPWLDRVVVLVDEDRWFDEQVFGWLAGRLGEVGAPGERLVVFNRTQRPAESNAGTEGPGGRSALAERARWLGAACVFLEYQPGRGLVRLDQGANRAAVQEIVAWLGRAEEAGAYQARSGRLLATLSQRAAVVLRENSRRLELLARLSKALEAELAAWERSEKRIAYEVLLSEGQRRQLDPVWQSVVRPAVWARDTGKALVSGRMLLGVLRRSRGEETDEGETSGGTIAQRGARYFADQLGQAAACMRSNALLSELWTTAGGAGLAEVDAVVLREQERGVALSRRCGDAFDVFAKEFERRARAVKVGTLSSGAAVIGAVIGGLITLPAGGVGVPAGAAIGAVIGATASLSGARSLYRLARLLVGTPELRALWDAIGEFRTGLRESQRVVREAILKAGSARVIETHDPLYGALDRLRTAPAAWARSGAGRDA